MESFTLKGYGDFIKITFDKVFDYPTKTCYWGGYDTKSIIEINSADFSVKSSFYIYTGEIYEFYIQLLKANDLLTGNIDFKNYEHNLQFTLIYDVNGQIIIKGVFSSQTQFDNYLNFEFRSDQSYIQATLRQLKVIVDKYGTLTGVK